MGKRIRILFLSADPANVDPRPPRGKEFREIAKRIRIGSERDAFKIVSEWAVRDIDLQEALLKHNPDILHLSVHGSQKGIVLENEQGNFKPVPKKALRGLLDLFKDKIKVVFFNGRCSKSQREALNGVIDYTIILNRTMPDESAIQFASAFYRSLAFGKNVNQAFELSKNDLGLQNLPGMKAPELLVRPGVKIDLPFIQMLVAGGTAAT